MNNIISKQILEHNTLSFEENNRLAVLAKNGDEEAKNKVVLNNLRLVVRLVNKYKQSENDEEDLFQSGVCGILRAINTYDIEKGLFSTHAFAWIRAMILKSFRENEDFHYESVFYNKCIRYEKLKAAIGQKNGDFTDLELYEFNLTQKDIEQIEQYSRKSYSLDALNETSDEFSNNIANDKIYNPDDLVENKIYEKEVRKLVSEEMRKILTDRELFVIRETYGIESGEPQKMTKVAEMLSKAENGKNYSRQRIQQIRTKAEKKLSKSSILKSLFLS